MEAIKVPSEASVSERLVTSILSGNSEAEIEMIERYQKGLGVMLFNRSRDRQLAEDVAQETWVLVLQKVRENQLRDKRKLAAFIIQIAKNQLIMRQRARQRHNHVGEDEAGEIVDQGSTPEQSYVDAQLGHTVRRLLAEMTVDRDRELLNSFYLKGEDKKVLCERYELSSAHFDRVMYRARERLKTIWLQNDQQ